MEAHQSWGTTGLNTGRASSPASLLVPGTSLPLAEGCPNKGEEPGRGVGCACPLHASPRALGCEHTGAYSPGTCSWPPLQGPHPKGLGCVTLPRQPLLSSVALPWRGRLI